MSAPSRTIQTCADMIGRLTRAQKRRILLMLDLVTTGAALAAAVNLAPPATPLTLVPAVAFGAFVLAASAALGLHRIKLNAFGTDGMLRAAGLALFAATMLHALAGLGAPRLGDLAVLLFGLLAFVALVGARVALLSLLLVILRHGKPRRAVLIYGAGETGLQLAAALQRHDAIRPVAFVDDDPLLHGMTVGGLRVHSPAALPGLSHHHDARRVILAMPGLSPSRQARITGTLQARGLRVQTVPSFAQIIGQEALANRPFPVSSAPLLGRAPVDAPCADRGTYTNRSLMVTGAGGTIGAELCRQLLAFNPAQLLLFDVSEAALYAVDKDLRRDCPSARIIPILGSVTDAGLLRSILARHRVDAIFHAAAYKHVPLVESNPVIGIENNVLGTRILAEAAEQARVARFILISTDKAVRPGNVMGATKRLAELAVQDLGHRARATRFSIVRFGNVLGSSGSVVPLFREQIAHGGPVTLTHDDATRYFMTIDEAAKLVLVAGSFRAQDDRRGTDVFVLDMGRPRRIRDLAIQMIEAAGYRLRDAANPDGDVEIHRIGLRQGEKLHEELFIGHERLPTPHPKILRASETGLSEFQMAQALRQLRAAVAGQDAEAARRLVFRWVEPARMLRAPVGAGSGEAGSAATLSQILPAFGGNH